MAGAGPLVVLLHAGVADRRSWYAVAPRLADIGTVVAYDRRGFGDSPPSTRPFRHLDDLTAVLGRLGPERAWLVGSSMGGQLALDAAVSSPDRIAGLVLFAPAVSGAPDPEQLDPDTQRLSDLLDAAFEAGDLEQANRLETWLWLDGPTSPEGRVAGPGRELALAMNGVVLDNAVPEEAGESGLNAWAQLEQIQVPTTIVWGDLDVPFTVEQSAHVAGRIPRSRQQRLSGMAHLPYLERPDLVADIIRGTIGTA